MDIHLCRPKDLEKLDVVMPSPGQTSFHWRRFQAQVEGKSSYLIAWVGSEPVGHLLLKWKGPDDERVQAYLPGAPELNAIGVIEEYRSRGIGSELINYAEILIIKRELNVAAIGVAVDNPRAKRLYERLGYSDWGRGLIKGSFKWLDKSGGERVNTEIITYLVKSLG